MDARLIDQWRFGTFAFGFATYFIFRNFGNENSIASQFLLTYEIVYLLTLFIILLVYFGQVSNPYRYMIILDFGTAIVTVMIIINSILYGFHKNE